MFTSLKKSADAIIPVFACLFLSLATTSGLTAFAQAADKNSPSEFATPEVIASPKNLSSAEQTKLLQTRLPGNVIGTLGSFAALLSAIEGTEIGSSSKEALSIELHGVYPSKDVYMPTYSEFFDMIARQTHTSFSYLPEVNVWVFGLPAMPLPYTIKKVAGWKEEDRGMNVAYTPEYAPVGLEINMMGSYSGLSEAQSKHIRELAALRFSKHINAKVTGADMTSATVNGVDALYFESAAPEANKFWRQWAFFKQGRLFVIVSACDNKNKEQIERDVDAMLKTFHVPAPLSTSQESSAGVSR